MSNSLRLHFPGRFSSTRFLQLLLISVLMLLTRNGDAQLYWRIDNGSASITSASWSTTGSAPFTSAWVAGSPIIFTANSNISYVSFTSVANLTVTNGSTVNWTPAGVYNGGIVPRIFNIGTGCTLNWNGQVFNAGTFGITKSGTGTWNMGSVSGNYSGGFTLGAGTITYTGASSNPFGTGALNINGGIITPIDGTVRSFPNSITVGGDFQLGDVINVPSGTGNITFSGTVNLGAANRTITIGNSGSYNFSGIISGGLGIGLNVAASSSGRIILSNASNTYFGATTINSGILQGGVSNFLPSNTALVLANAASAQLLANGAGINTTVGSIAGGGPTGGNINIGNNNLSTGGDNTSTSYGGVISGTGGSFTKTGTGTQTLTGANTYSGATNVNGGSLLVNGSLNSASTVNVASAGTLGGSGNAPGTIALSGTVSPGGAATTTGTFNTGAVTFGANSTYLCEVSNVAGTQGAASGWDFLNVSGAINVSATPINITLTGLGGNGFNNNATYTWIIATGTSIVGFNPANFSVTHSGFSATGTFAVEQSGNSLQVVYTPPSGNTITLTPLTQLPGGSYCNGVANNTITLTYVTSGTVTAPAIELSDATGSFLSGTVQLPGTITPGSPNTITGVIPAGQPASALYRVRIISSDAIPVISGNNGNNLTVTNALVPSVSIAITAGANPSCAGSSITFTATPVNGGAPGYQWRRNGVDIGGANSVTYTSSSLANGDVISCRMTSSLSCITASSVLSNNITLTVNNLPANPGNPVAAGVNPSCGSNSLNTMAPDPNTTFYWQGTVLNGQSTLNSTASAYPVSASGTYYVTALSTDGCWSAGSGSIAITVNNAASISAQPADRNINAGTNTTFSVTAANATAYQWQENTGSGFADIVNGGVYSGATSATLTLTGVPIGFNGYTYRCIIKAGACADLPSNGALLSVNPVPWEDFETGSKPSYTPSAVLCTAGTWAFNEALLATDVVNDFIIGTKSARININGEIQMFFNLPSLGVVRLSHRTYGSDANSNWQLQGSTNNGATWAAFSSPVFTATSTVQTANILVNIAGNIRFRIVNLETSGNHRINIDDIYVTAYNGCVTPTGQATYSSVNSVLSTSMTINFGAGTGGNGRIVVVKQGSPVTGFPTSGVNYLPGSSDFSTGLPTIAPNEKVVYNGTGTSVNVTGLTPNTTYFFQVFEYAGTNCYLVSTVANTGSAATACNIPATNASAVNASAVTTTTATLSWTNGSGSNRLVVVNAGSPVSGAPVNGNTYSVNSSFSAAPAFAPGTGKTVYNSTSNTVSLTNLASNTLYHVAVFEFNSGTNCYVSTGAVASFATGSLLSDIVSANGESSCISSVINSNITTVSDGVQAWQIAVRDGGASAPDLDGLPTIVNSIVITQGAGNTVADWTNLQSAALFDGSTLISTGVITANNITFSGAPLVTVADNGSKTLSLRISLKATTTIPNTIDGRIFRFSITQGNITLAGSGSSGKNLSAPVATSDVTKDVVCVVATKLVYTVQPSNTGQNDAMLPNVVVKAYDANNNVDLNFTQAVTITSTAGLGLLGTPISATAIAGVATFTGIKHTTTGTYTMTAASGGVTNAVSASYVINTVTTFAPGDFAILAVNNNNTNNVDEIAFVVFKEIAQGTSFYMTDNGYERVNAGQWGGTEGVVRLTYTGAAAGGPAPAGSVFVIQGNNASFNMLRCGVSDNGNWTINPRALFPFSSTPYYFNMNNNDQVWFTQGGNWTSASGSATSHDATTDGTVLYGWTGIDWKPNIGNTPVTWTTQGSRLYPQMGCFSTNLNLPTDIGKYKYVGPMTAATRLGWISRINDISNWQSYTDNPSYDAAPINYATGTGFVCPFTVSPGVPVDGKWTGAKNSDWFDCNNWDTREVPNATISVVIDNTAISDCVVDNVTYATNAIQYGNAANCFNLTVNNKLLSTGNPADVINVNGNFSLTGGATLNMTGGGTFNLQTGSWTKTASTFTSGTGTVSYNSAANQNIAVEDYFNLSSTSTGSRVFQSGSVTGIAGTFSKGTNAYTFTGSTINYNGAGAQTITPFTAGLSTGSTYHHLRLSNSGVKSLGGSTDVEADLQLNNTVTLSLGNHFLNLKSTATQTARVAPVAAGVNITYGTGRFVVERYFPGRRAWRMITAPVTAEASRTLFNSYQVGGSNSLAGSGTYITGPTAPANGLDVSPLNNFSLRTFNQATSVWDGVSDPAVRLISGTAGISGAPDNTAYFMFVRGDRTPANVDAFNQFGTVNETTLRDTGFIQYKSYTFNCNPSAGTHKYTAIGNPYASPVDFDNVTKIDVANKFHAWDPKLSTVGGYVVVDRALGSITPNFSTQTNIIQSKQAVLVETTGAAPTVTFSEAAKSATNNLTLFRPSVNRQTASLNSNLYIVNADGSTTPADGNLVQFDAMFSNASDQLDAVRFTNINETFGIANAGNLHIVDRRPFPVRGDSIQFNLRRTRRLQYRLQLEADKLAMGNLQAYLEDKYSKTSTPIKMNGITDYDFEVNADAASAAADRLYIVFRRGVRFTDINAVPVVSDVVVNWQLENDGDLQRFEVERAPEGGAFEKVAEVTQRKGASTTWTYTDANLAPGVYSFRVKGITATGVTDYTEEVRVKITARKAGMYVYPNPVTGQYIGLQMAQQPAGIYQVRLLSAEGSVVLRKQLVHDAGTATEQVQCPAGLPAGTYRLEVTGPDKRRESLLVMVGR